jgi:hypothetical protein
MGTSWGVRVAARRRRVTSRGVGVGARLVSRMSEDGRAVAEAKARGQAPARASNSVARWPACGG